MIWRRDDGKRWTTTRQMTHRLAGQSILATEFTIHDQFI